MDGVDVFKLFASDFGTVNVFAGERMINMVKIQDDDEKMCRQFFFSFFPKANRRLKVKSKSNANFSEKKNQA